MTIKHLGDAYDFESFNREEAYGGDINFYINWHKHLMYACPSAYRAPVDMNFRDFLENMLRPDYAQHPDTEKLDFDQCEWTFDHQPWTPDFSKSIKENGIDHMAYLEFTSPGLDGMHGVGN